MAEKTYTASEVEVMLAKVKADAAKANGKAVSKTVPLPNQNYNLTMDVKANKLHLVLDLDADHFEKVKTGSERSFIVSRSGSIVKQSPIGIAFNESGQPYATDDKSESKYWLGWDMGYAV